MPQPPELRELQRVVPIMETRELSRGQLTCVALELYDDGWWLNFWIDFMVDVSQLSSPLPNPPLEIAARDDQGNEYTGWMAGGAGGGSLLRVWYRFGPSLASDADSLHIRVRIGESETGPVSRDEPVVWSSAEVDSDGSGTTAGDYMTVTVSLA